MSDKSMVEYLAGGAAAFTLPWYAIMVLPILFAAGMSLFDTIDGTFMNFAYGWAFSKPTRKVFYNLVITALSVTVALAIGTIEVVSVLADQLQVSDGPMGWVASLDLNYVDFVVDHYHYPDPSDRESPMRWAVAIVDRKTGDVHDMGESSGLSVLMGEARQQVTKLESE